jgi:hypothetical protein
VKKFTQYGIITLKWIAIVVLSIWIGLAAFFYFEKADLMRQVSDKLKERTHGDISIGDMSSGLIKTFPFFSIELSDIIIRDSLWKYHHQDFLKAQKVYCRFHSFTLFSGHPRLSKLIVENGVIQFYSDSTGYSNSYLVKQKQPGNNQGTGYPDILLKQMKIAYRNLQRHKSFDFYTKKTSVHILDQDSNKVIRIKTNSLVKDLAFNVSKGSYLKNKALEGTLRLIYSPSKKEIGFSNTLLEIDDHPFYFNGAFSLDSASNEFALAIATKNVNYEEALSLLTDSLRGKLKKYAMAGPLALQVDIGGRMQQGSKPKVVVNASVTNNTVSTPVGDFTQCTFEGRFNNQLNPSLPAADENSVLELTSFSGKWEGMPLRSRKITITNLKKTLLECDVLSDFDITSLNGLAGSNTLQFDEGRGHLEIVYKGLVNEGDSSSSSIDGNLTLENGVIKYLPRNFILSHCSGILHFKNKSLQIERLNTIIGRSRLVMSGSVDNFLSLLSYSPEKVSMEWHLFSPKLFLEDFSAFLGREGVGIRRASKNAKFGGVAAKVDRMFIGGSMSVTVTTPRISYKKFAASDVNARVLLTPAQVVFKDVTLQHAGGSIRTNGVLLNRGSLNTVKLRAYLNKIHIPELFYAFNDFGQDAITHKNLNGDLSATVDLRASVTDKAEIIRDNTEGHIDFLIENGELNHFEPVEKVQQTAFKKQNFSEIRFATLKNNIEVKGTAFILKKMEIRSSALTMFVEGVYDTKSGTNMSIQLPVRNLFKNNSETDLTEAGKRGHGISIRLRAQSGDDGKLKVSWDPFKKALKDKGANKHAE